MTNEEYLLHEGYVICQKYGLNTTEGAVFEPDKKLGEEIRWTHIGSRADKTSALIKFNGWEIPWIE